MSPESIDILDIYKKRFNKDFGSIIGCYNDYDVYQNISNLLSDGWNGKYLIIKIPPEEDIDCDLLSCLETGLLNLKDRKSLVWNSQRIFIVADNHEIFYRKWLKVEDRNLSPREIRINIH
jgi:hypothetical protein